VYFFLIIVAIKKNIFKIFIYSIYIYNLITNPFNFAISWTILSRNINSGKYNSLGNFGNLVEESIDDFREQFYMKTQNLTLDEIYDRFSSFSDKSIKKQLEFYKDNLDIKTSNETINGDIIFNYINSLFYLLKQKTPDERKAMRNNEDFINNLALYLNAFWKIIASASTNAADGAKVLVEILNELFEDNFAVIKCQDDSSYECGRIIFANLEEGKQNRIIIYETISDIDDQVDTIKYAMEVIPTLEGGNQINNYFHKYLKYKNKYMNK